VASYRIKVKRSAAKEIAALQKADCQRVVARLQALADEPGCEKLTGNDKYRVREGDYRILYEIDEKSRTVTIVKVRNRKEVYR
jgi:mRNA interferase RelE/StbE